MKKIDLENMDGEEFEILCKEIFSKFYNVDVDKTPLVGDGGKDLIIRMPEGAVYVECKHHHNSTIGRPIVQKLHSAMVTDWVKKGIIVTTGTFSKQAEDHIEKNSLPIELIDGHKFKEMAESVGYELFYGYDVNIPTDIVNPFSSEELSAQCAGYINNTVESSPDKPAGLFVPESVDTVMDGFLRVEYNISQEFYNSKKDMLIYKIDDHGVLYLHDGTLSSLDTKTCEFITKGERIPLSEYDGPEFDTSLTSIRSDVEEAAYAQIIEKYTCDHPYVTTNNQNRVKHIVPSRKNIEIFNITGLFVPSFEIRYEVIDTHHQLSGMENGKTVAITSSYTCDVCRKTNIAPKLCGYCGSLVCDNHGARCSICNRTMCKNCGLYFKKALLFKKTICPDCAKSNPGLKTFKIDY